MLFCVCLFVVRSDTEAMKDLSKGIPDKWRLFFKLFCFVNPQNVPLDNIESAFMFEQVIITVSFLIRNPVVLACTQ